VRAIAFDKHQRVQRARVEIMRKLDPLAGRRLKRREPECPSKVTGDNPVHGRIAEIAYAVKEDDGMWHAQAFSG
jgi:hypothetical protein